MTTFIDTNIVAYAHDQRDMPKALMAIKVLTGLWAVGSGAVSTQALQEFYSAATSTLRPR